MRRFAAVILCLTLLLSGLALPARAEEDAIRVQANAWDLDAGEIGGGSLTIVDGVSCATVKPGTEITVTARPQAGKCVRDVELFEGIFPTQIPEDARRADESSLRYTVADDGSAEIRFTAMTEVTAAVRFGAVPDPQTVDAVELSGVRLSAFDSQQASAAVCFGQVQVRALSGTTPLPGGVRLEYQRLRQTVGADAGAVFFSDPEKNVAALPDGSRQRLISSFVQGGSYEWSALLRLGFRPEYRFAEQVRVVITDESGRSFRIWCLPEDDVLDLQQVSGPEFTVGPRDEKVLGGISLSGVGLSFYPGEQVRFSGVCRADAPYRLVSEFYTERTGADPDLWPGAGSDPWYNSVYYDGRRLTTFSSGGSYEWSAIVTMRDDAREQGYVFATDAAARINGTAAQVSVFADDPASARISLPVTVLSTVPFSDIDPGAYYYDPVLWAVKHSPQITTGTDAARFSPDETCTRGQVVTFLWRAMGCPKAADRSNPFRDVAPGDYYCDAVLWALEAGITTGTDAAHFSPEEGCTRAQAVTFLWRAEQRPDPGTSVNPFADVGKDSYAFAPVLWAVARGITRGTDAAHFSPDEVCTRGQIVTFLFRDLN